MQKIDYAVRACETMMKKFAASELPPKKRFHYHQGVFLSGMYKTYEICGDERYLTYIKDWLDSVVDEDGKILGQVGIQMDDMQPGILLYPMIDRFDDPRYEKALKFLINQFETYPRNSIGGLWHKDSHPNQMWLDGLYMGGPILAEYGRRYNSQKHLDFVVQQVKLMIDNTRDPKTGLLYHAWDESKEANWCDPATGLAPEFWGRSIGWVPVAVLDDLDFLSQNSKAYAELSQIVAELITSICGYQSTQGRWYQVVNKNNDSNNWLETSCSCLFVAAICKAVRMGLLNENFLSNAQKGFDGVVSTIKYDGEDILIGDVCVGTGVGNYKFYCERPTSVNDLHGVGAFLLMCAEAERVLK